MLPLDNISVVSYPIFAPPLIGTHFQKQIISASEVSGLFSVQLPVLSIIFIYKFLADCQKQEIR